MTLVTITGYITTFARDTEGLTGLQLWFVPTGNGVSGDHLYVTKEVPAKSFTQSSGAFEVDLEDTDTVYGVPDGQLRYFPRITWFNGLGQFKHQDFVNWRIRVPQGGGTLEELLDAPTNADAVYVSYAPTYEALEEELGTVSIGTWIYWVTAPIGVPNRYEVEA